MNLKKPLLMFCLSITGVLTSTLTNAQVSTAETSGIDLVNDRDRGSLDQGGENCASALVIPSLPFCDVGTTVGYAHDYTPTCAGGGVAPDVVYRYTSPVTQNVIFSFCGSDFENTASITTNCTGAPFLCAWSNCGNSACAAFTAVGGTTYYIILDGIGGASGNYQLNAAVGGPCVSTPCVAPNDDCNNAILISPGTYPGVTEGATIDNVPYCAAGGEIEGPGVWYRVVGQGRMARFVLAADATFPARLGLYCGNCPCLSCYRQTTGCSSDTLEVCLANGVTYYLLVSSCDGSTGSFTLHYTQWSPCAPVIACAPSLEVPLFAPGTRSGNTCDECGDCSLQNSAEVVIPVSLPGLGWWTFSLCGSNFNTYMYIGLTPCSATYYSNNDSCGVQSASPCLFIAGVCYVTIEGVAPSNCGDYMLEVLPCSPPLNDDCENAISISGAQTIHGTTASAAMDSFPADPDCDPPLWPGVWYKYTGTDRITSFNMVSNTTHQFSLFQHGCCGRLSCLFQGECGMTQSFGLCLGSDPCAYYILISGCNVNSGPFTFNITEGATCNPNFCGLYDHVTNAPIEVSGTTCGKCNDCALLGAGEEVTARFTIGSAGLYTISAVTDFRSRMYIGNNAFCANNIYTAPDCATMHVYGCANFAAGFYIITLEPCDPVACGNYTISMLPCVLPAGNLVIQWAAPSSVQLNWEPSAAPVSGYNVYRSLTPDVATIPANFVAMTPDTFYVDAIPALPETKNFYAITAVAP